MSNIENLEVTVEDYLAGLAAGIDILELKRLENQGIPTHLALEVLEITEKVVNKTATDAEIVRGLIILTPSLREELINSQPNS
ncbi:MAG TPA: hypothetical protein DCY88_08685 [Cyanobacteria bacterium UBA11372]|nr:hypothetical protein [Cyanobacteria bacterium UBA11372]